jgi:hypothetical protein
MFEELRARSLVYAATAPDDPLGNMWGQPPSPALSKVEGAVQAGRSSAGFDSPGNSGFSPGKDAAALPQTRSHGERRTVITLALLGSDAGLYGAARATVLEG